MSQRSSTLFITVTTYPLRLSPRGGFAARSGESGLIVFRAEQGVADAAVRQTIEELLTSVATEVNGVTVTSPYAPGARGQSSQDGRVAYAELSFETMSFGEYTKRAQQIRQIGGSFGAEGLTIEYGGGIFAEQATGGASELIGILAAVVILLIAFGSLLAMGMPIVTTLFGIGSGITLLSHLIKLPDFATQVAAMIGIGVGIDYALFIVTRYRVELAAGREPEAAALTAMATAGRAVLWAGITVVVSLLGMFFMGLALMSGLAVSAAGAVLLVMLATLTLVPALLGFAGKNIDRLGLPHRQNHRHADQSFWHRWSRMVERRPLVVALLALSLLLTLGSPILVMRLGFLDAGNRPDGDTTRRAYDLIAKDFGAGFNGPLLIAVDSSGDAEGAALQRLQQELPRQPGIAFATPPIPGENGIAIMQLFPATAPQEEATDQLILRLRHEVVPGLVADSGAEVRVGGVTAGGIDFAYNTARLPLFIGAVLTLSFLLLVVVFRSPLVALKAVIMNLLSIGAAYGIIVSVFQWGWGEGLLGVGRAGLVEAWIPMMLFAIVFGLSMDYEVFLISRIREEYKLSGDNETAVAHGLAGTARVISAAAIMICVFASFILLPDLPIKMFGLGLAAAVLVDATIVRLLLVPATMQLLGRPQLVAARVEM